MEHILWTCAECSEIAARFICLWSCVLPHRLINVNVTYGDEAMRPGQRLSHLGDVKKQASTLDCASPGAADQLP
jgi:hypothetical protein